MLMRATATVLCNNILQRAKKEKIDVTPMKLQKILYYICVKYVQETGELPISEHFEVWKYGPVAVSVYNEFKTFGVYPIKAFAKDARGKVQVIDESCSPNLSYIIDFIWNKFKNYTGIKLSKRTQQKGSGWYIAYQNNRNAISTEDMKNDSTI